MRLLAIDVGIGPMFAAVNICILLNGLDREFYLTLRRKGLTDPWGHLACISIHPMI